jgi:hypothetical protein
LRAGTDGDFVWLVRGDTVEQRYVEVGGNRDRPQILIVNGLAPGDTIVRSAAEPLTPGRKITTN